MKLYSTTVGYNSRMTKKDKSILKQAEYLIKANEYIANHLDTNVYIHWRDNKPVVLLDKLHSKELKTQGFESMVNTVKLEHILDGSAKFG